MHIVVFAEQGLLGILPCCLALAVPERGLLVMQPILQEHLVPLLMVLANQAVLLRKQLSVCAPRPESPPSLPVARLVGIPASRRRLVKPYSQWRVVYPRVRGLDMLIKVAVLM